MIKQEKISLSLMSMLGQKMKDYQQLMKFNLSLLVVFSSVIGYIIIPSLPFDILKIVYLFIGGLLIAGAANATNELIEKEDDKLMKRTADRPLPAERMLPAESILFIGLALIIGLGILYYQFNALAAALSLGSYLLYAFVYTPLKKITPLSVLVGALPGALPCLIGWAAGTGSILSTEAWVLFGFQFFWQFPHFWAIAWVADEDYKKAGMKMLPQENKESRFTAFQTVFYSAILIPLAALPYVLGLSSLVGTIVMAIAAAVFVWFALEFYKYNNDDRARKLMFASFIYLPIILFTLLIDKFI